MKKIVLVMDSAIIAMEIKRNLESVGYLVPFIKNTLIDLLDEVYDMDLMILDMDFVPLDNIGEVKSPIIFLSSKRESEISYGDVSGVEVTYDFLYKPFTEEELLFKTGQILTSADENS